MSRFAWARALAASLLIAGTGSAAVADDLANRAFQLQFDASGIRSLRRTADVHDTDYIAANGALGRLLIRFRSTPNGHWRELRELLLRAPSSTTGGPQAIEYALGTLLPTLASKASPSAVRGVGTLRGLNDGLVPVPPGAGGRRCGGRHLSGIGVVVNPYAGSNRRRHDQRARRLAEIVGDQGLVRVTPDLTAIGATNDASYFVQYLTNPAAFGNTVMGSYAYLGQENLAALGEFLAASKGTDSSK